MIQYRLAENEMKDKLSSLVKENIRKRIDIILCTKGDIGNCEGEDEIGNDAYRPL